MAPFYSTNSRYYNPEIGRNINAKDVSEIIPSSINGGNQYIYSVNNPVMVRANTERVVQVYGTSAVSGIVSSCGGINNDGNSSTSGFFNKYTVNGSFRNELFYGKGSATLLYTESHARFNWDIRKGKLQIGFYNKTSLANANGQVGIGDSNLGLSLKGVVGTVTTFAGVIVNPNKNDYFIGVQAKASVLTACGGVQLDILGIPIETGGSIEVLSIGGNFGLGIQNGEFYYSNGASVLFGYTFYLRIKLWDVD
jgi:hypothetical protein